MLNGYARAMQRYMRFEGRADRAEFWQFIAGLALLVIAGRIIDGQIAKEQGQAEEIVTGLVGLAHILPALAVTVRRLHDIDRTGWWILLNTIPPLNVVLLIFACLKGTVGPNRYGLDLQTDATEGQLGSSLGNQSGPVRALPTTPARNDVIADIERLGHLRREGHLSEAEFEVMKAETLAQGRR